MKEVTKEQMELLIKNGVVRNSSKGFVDKNENQIGFYRTRNRRYIEDKYVDIAKKTFLKKGTSYGEKET